MVSNYGFLQLSGLHHLERFNLSYLSLGTLLSLPPPSACKPTTVYHTTLKTDQVKDCNKDICTRVHSFVNMRRQACQAKYVT